MLPTPTPYPDGNYDIPQLDIGGMNTELAYALVGGYNRINDNTRAFDLLFFLVIVFMFVFLIAGVRTMIQRWRGK